ncbi:hypothetical protein ACLOJK_008151 [Asimina triloba]
MGPATGRARGGARGGRIVKDGVKIPSTKGAPLGRNNGQSSYEYQELKFSLACLKAYPPKKPCLELASLEWNTLKAPKKEGKDRTWQKYATKLRESGLNRIGTAGGEEPLQWMDESLLEFLISKRGRPGPVLLKKTGVGHYSAETNSIRVFFHAPFAPM